jgi:hypothetical protein
LFWGPQACQQIQTYCKDLFALSLPNDTTAVLPFRVTPLMKPLSMKLEGETRLRIHVLSYQFPIPIQDVDNAKLVKLVYGYKEMRTYEVVGGNESEAQTMHEKSTNYVVDYTLIH